MHAQGGAAERKDPALHFHLREAGIAGAQVDIRGQHQFDTDRVAVALSSDDHRFAHSRPAEHPPRVTAVVRDLPAGGKLRRYVCQVQTSGEVFTMGKYQRHTRIAVALELAVSPAQIIQHGHIESIAFARSVQADQHDLATFFTADAAAGALGHGWESLCAGR